MGGWRCRKPNSGDTARQGRISRAKISNVAHFLVRTNEATRTEHGKAHIKTRGGRTAMRANRTASLSYMYRMKRDPEISAHVHQISTTHVDLGTGA